MKNIILPVVAFFLFSQPVFSQKTVTTLQVPGAAEFCKIDPAGYSVLPSGRYVTPAGKAVPISRAPYGLAISPDGQVALVLHNDVVTKIDLRYPDRPVRMPSYDKAVPAVLEGSSCMGMQWCYLWRPGMQELLCLRWWKRIHL